MKLSRWLRSAPRPRWSTGHTAPVRYKLLARTAGDLLDLVTVAGMAAGLRERLAGHDGRLIS